MFADNLIIAIFFTTFQPTFGHRIIPFIVTLSYSFSEIAYIWYSFSRYLMIIRGFFRTIFTDIIILTIHTEMPFSSMKF